MKKILFVNHEITPYVPDSELSLAGKNVPFCVQEKGCEIRTFMPKWGNINERRGQLHEVIRLSGLNIVIDDIDHPTIIKVASIPQTKIQVYFIDNEDFFMKRGMDCDENGVPYADNAERAIFFARGVIDTIKKLRWTPDIIHCQGWMSAFLPFYIKKAYNDDVTVCNAKIVTSFFSPLGITPIKDPNIKKHIEYKNITADDLAGYEDTMTGTDLAKLAIEYSDGLICGAKDVDPKILDMIANSGKKCLEYPGEDFADAYINFYDSLFEE